MIRFFTSQPELYNDWRWLWSGPWSFVSLVFLGIFLLIALYWSWRSSQRLPSYPQKITLFTLRVLGAVLLWMFVAGPAVELRHVQKRPNFLPIVIDTSASMNIQSGNQGTSRFAQTKRFFKENQKFFDKLQLNHKVRFFQFDRKVKPTTQALSGLQPKGSQTDLLRLGIFLRERFGHLPLAGIVLATDGIDTLAHAQASQGTSKDGQASKRKFKTNQRLQHFRKILKQLNVPVHVVAPPRQRIFQDVAVSEVYGDAFAFLHNKLTIEVRVKAAGYSEVNFPVNLYKEGRLLQSKSVLLKGLSAEKVISFEFRPRKAGQFVYSVRIPAQRGEALVANNQKSFILKIIRNRIRVLQVTGRPSWDVRYLRRLLKKNASVDLISFFILRTIHNIRTDRTSERELALIPFPSRELFTKKLGTFDLVIFQNFNFAPYLPKYYLSHVEKFIRKGGGFVMTGGDLSFGAGGYLGTSLSRALPHKLNLGQTDTRLFRPALTKAGRHHPITQLLADPKANQDLWKLLPPLHGSNLVGDPRYQGTVLLQRPNQKTDSGRPTPILSVRQYHKGRVMSLTTDDSWRWNFQHVGRGGTQAAYYRFWNNAIRWLIRDPELERIRISTFRSPYEWGETARFRIRVLNREYRPQRKGKLKIEIRKALGTKIIFRTTRKIPSNGMVLQDWQPKKPGIYRVLATFKDKKRTVLKGQALFEVKGLHNEYQELQPNERLFTLLRNDTKGLTIRSDTTIDSLPLLAPKVLRINRSRTIDLWDNLYLLFLFFSLFGLEWFLRRKWGLP